MAGTAEPKESKNSLDILYEETKQLLVRQLAVVEALDTKASIVAGLDGALTGAALGLLGSAKSLWQCAAQVFQPWVLLVAAAAATVSGLVSAGFALLGAFWPRTYVETIWPHASRLLA